jgi:hypothetical protein
MSISSKNRRIPGLLEFTLFACCLSIGGCPQQTPQQLPPRYPSVVYDIPRCYDAMPKKLDKCEDKGFYDVYLSFAYLTNSDIELWKDITDIRKKNRSWRFIVSRASTGEYLDGTDWRPITGNDMVRMKTKPDDGGKIPREVLLRAEFEFCSDTPDKCDDPSAKIIGRNINFLMHEFPEKT